MAKYEERRLDAIKTMLNQQEKQVLSTVAATSASGIRRQPDEREASDYRQPFSIDVDRLLHSLAYTRYIDKTQVFYLVENDHITHRVLHVQLVSKIARTIGRFLSLNQDLIEAIALGHDIGHTPFGHDGERFLSDLCQRHGIGYFHHNVQSIQFLDRVERKGKGWNLCLQTLDGILCHDGEVHTTQLTPEDGKTFEQLDMEVDLKTRHPETQLIPMTMEGCVVRMADTISYIGRDIEDAIRLGMIRRADLPRQCTRLLGRTNGTIVFSLVTDIIANSYQKDHIAFSEEISEALMRLKTFNLERIYLNPQIKAHTQKIRTLFEYLFETYLRDLEKENRKSVLYTHFLKDMAADYGRMHKYAEIVRDFIAGMTDKYFLKQCPPQLRPTVRDLR